MHKWTLFMLLACGIILAGCADENDRPVSSEDDMPAPVAGENLLSGVVTDSSGNPLSEAGVAVTSGSVAAPEILVLTNEQGVYSWPLPPGTFTLTVFKDGYAEMSQDITIKEGQPTRLDFHLQSNP